MAGWELITKKDMRLANHLLNDNHFLFLEVIIFSYCDQRHVHSGMGGYQYVFYG